MPQLVVPMSGIGKRFIDAGYSDPKPLIKVDGEPMVKHVVNMFGNPDDVIFICNEKHLKETNMRDVLTSISPNCKIYEVPNENRRGPVDAVRQIFEHIDDDREIIVSYCDYGTHWDYNNFLNEVREGDFDGSIACYIGFHPHMLGSDNYAFCKEKDKVLLEIKEKEPFTDNKMNEYASNGTYYFKSGKLLKKYFQELIDLDINLKGEYYVSLVYNLLIQDGLKVNIFEIDNMLQWGTPYDLEVYRSWSNYFRKPNMQKIKNPKKTTLILPMAGKGSRFSEEGYKIPKPLIPIDEKPMVVKAVDCLPESEKNVFICLDEHLKKYDLENILKKYVKNTSILALDQTTKGQACTCELGINEFNIDMEDPIMISACDNGVYYDVEKYKKLLEDKSVDIIVWSFRNNQSSKINPNAYAWLKVDESDNIKHVSCKNFIYDDPLKTHAIIGTMFFRKAKYFIDGLKSNYIEDIKTNGEFYVDDVLNQNIKQGLNVKVFEVDDYICWGTPNDYETYNYWQNYFNKIKNEK